MRSIAVAVAVAIILSGTRGQYFPPSPEGVTRLPSKIHEGVELSYKEPGICETTPGVKSYSGYVHLPPGTLLGNWEASQDYPINTFFWFFESRIDPSNAPLSIWLNGGPGGSSMVGALRENGPCLVGSDSNSTYLNPYSWNNEVNMLYIDQPVQVGFSYDILTNITKNLATHAMFSSHVEVADFSGGVPVQNDTFLVGTMGSQLQNHTANSTSHAAHAIWHFAQIWFEEFPFYKPKNGRVSIWGESYAGKYGPSMAAFFEKQNEKIASSPIDQHKAHYLHVETVGIINGCVDKVCQALAYADMAYNNTYGIQAYNHSMYTLAVNDFKKEGGCKDQLLRCRELEAQLDQKKIGSVKDVNEACFAAMEYCDNALTAPYMNSTDKSWYDITHPERDPFPPPYLVGFLSQHWVQSALGVPVNYSGAASIVGDAFEATGDDARGGYLEDLAYLLNKGSKVAMVYGDRDFACNWIGGEQASLAINYHGSSSFKTAGYMPIITNSTFVGGQVRQYGNLSFSRVYQAGHEVPAYQPHTAYELFMRAMFNRDMATGHLSLTDDYHTIGPSSTWNITNEVLEPPDPVCYILVPDTCTEEQHAAVMNNTAIIKDYIVIGIMGDDNEIDVQNRIGSGGKYLQQVLGTSFIEEEL